MKGMVLIMSVMDKFLNYMKLNGEDDDDEYYDDEYLDDEEDVEPVPARRTSSAKQPKAVVPEDDLESRPMSRRPPASTSSKITPIKQPAARRVAGNAGMEVCVIKPGSVEDAREITETLLANRTVVLNLEGLDVDISQRIIDFTSGSCFAISGNLQKISHYIFIITPPSVDISGDFQDIFGDSFEMPLQ